MALPQSELLVTEEEYLRIERSSEERYEYIDGYFYLMAGESPAHGDISMNLSIIIGSQLRGTPCRARAKDTKVRSGPTPRRHRNTKGLYSYPDLVVVCGEPKYLDDHQDVLLNPKVIIEVLSPSTQAFDWGEKFIRYRTWLPSLTDYIVVAQDQPLIEHYARQENGLWYIAATVTEISGSFTIASINCDIALTDVYDRVAFPLPEEDQEEIPNDN